jgi:hypothetical protein
MKLNGKPFALVALAGACVFTTGAAFAQADPMFVRGDVGPAQYAPARMMPVDVRVDIGWHGDRYWDGHRYWAHDEWMRHHPHDADPRRFHDDHRPRHD